jgi:hypothetical protein
MKYNFCTLFDSNYLARGEVMYFSLAEHCSDFHLYVFAFDKKAEEYLRRQNFENLTVIGLSEFEDAELLRIKPTRSAAEYCWTCTPSTILYCIEKYKLDNCTYLDADMFFYDDPGILIREMDEKDVLLTEHRYSPGYDQSAVSGRFCVQFMTFRNTENGLTALRWWREACIEWCYARAEDGKFGDQKYLDDWETRFKGVHVLEHSGGGIAPWNIQQFEFFKKEEKIFVKEISTGKTLPLVFCHYHGVKFFKDDIVQLAGAPYDITEEKKQALYFPYITKLVRQANDIEKTGATFDPNGATINSPSKPWNLRLALFFYLADVKAAFGNILGGNMNLRKRHHHYYRTSNFGSQTSNL